MTFQRATARRIIALVRARVPGVRVVVGGYDPSLAPEAWTAPALGVDAIVRGEGEITFRDLLLSDRGKSLGDIMLKDPFTLQPDMQLRDAWKAVRNKHFPVYPVTDEQGTLVGVVRGITGFGGAMVMAPPLALLLGPRLAVPVVLLLECFAAAPQVLQTRRLVRWRVMGPILAATCVTVPFGGYLLLTADALALRRATALIVIVFSLLLLRGWRYAGSQKTLTGMGLGGLAGAMLGATRSSSAARARTGARSGADFTPPPVVRAAGASGRRVARTVASPARRRASSCPASSTRGGRRTAGRAARTASPVDRC